MFKHGFPPEWSTLKKLVWIVGTGIAGASAVWKTVTGTLIHITDALASPVKELSVAIEPQQSGSGDPSPTNVRPITGWTGCNVWVKPEYDTSLPATASVTFHPLKTNLFTSEIESGTINSGVNAESETRCRAKDLIPVLPNTEYTINYGLEISGTKNIGVITYAQDGSYIEDAFLNATLPKTFTTGENVHYIRTIFRTSVNSQIIPSYIKHVQLETGATASPNGLFSEQIYKVKYDFITGDGLATDLIVVADGTVNVVAPSSSYNGTVGTTRRFDATSFVASGLKTVVSDMFKGVDDAIWTVPNTNLWKATLYDKNVVMVFENSAVGIEEEDSAATRSTKIREWLKDNPATFIVPLADPIPFHVDPQQISTLSGENNVWGSGNIELTYKAQAE